MKRTIGILGGMGPEASARFYQEVIRYCQQQYHAVQDDDYPPMVLYSLPLPGFDETGIADGRAVLTSLLHGVSTLTNAGCDFIVIPCNTVHCYIDEMRAHATVPVLSIVEETAACVAADGCAAVGLLGSETTLQQELYQHELEKNGVVYLTPNSEEQQFTTQLILEAMGNTVREETRERVLSIVSGMEQRSVNGIVLGCTELPLALTQAGVHTKVYNSLQLLAASSVEYAMESTTAPPLSQSEVSVEH